VIEGGPSQVVSTCLFIGTAAEFFLGEELVCAGGVDVAVLEITYGAGG
jgi:hypothetical protein